MRRLVVAAVAALALLLAGCGGFPEGPAGTVVGKDRDYVSKHWEYELTTRDKKGEQHEFRVKRDDYNDCYRGSRYPKCTER